MPPHCYLRGGGRFHLRARARAQSQAPPSIFDGQIEEASGLWCAALELETLAHGHVAALGAPAAAVGVLTHPPPLVAKRFRVLADAAAHVAGAVVVLSTEGEGWGEKIGVVPLQGGGTSFERLISAAPTLQTLALFLAQSRGRCPDQIGEEGGGGADS
jgi:glucosamine 6-phosphate synthetase-like amidotransferase/phosphosugar isomerase protein